MENTVLRDGEQLLNATDVAHFLNISRAMAYRLMQHGKIRTVSIGTAKRVRIKDLRNFVENNLSPMSEV
ncbi:MAG: helix-turn-helix domain-containing protein [Chloroflexi bacterium]|nr:helix-turn-helix domain-containing protein [Chloroflexota bacterium]